MEPSTSPQRISIDTADPDEAHGYLRATYVDHSVTLSGSQDRFRFRHHLTDGGNFFVARYEHSMNCRVDTEPFGYLLMGQMFSGRLRLSTGREELSPAKGELFMLDPLAPMVINWDDFQAGLVRLDLDVVDRVAAEVMGQRARGGVRFALSKAVSPTRAANWQNLVRYLTRDFCGNEMAYSSPLIHSQTMRLLAATVLETFPNTTMADDPIRPGNADASAVRRATAFVDDHAGDPIGLAEIAAAARVGPRSLQDAFRRHLETTPMSYVREVRLARAHRDLVTADPTTGATVADIATRWGFAHHGRFAALYRERYGRSPIKDLQG
ncbi:AraC family transcriptional regulator [Pseudonocardia sp. GCM10023141]|uniref:AraC family transcriptional regulator n=1 Tax=Pseudonocardia sp. GCM10023141 TaxID=3252653 RepID=UPI003623ECC4